MIIFATIRIKKTTINKLHTIMESNQELIISCENKAKEWLSSSSFNEETRKEGLFCTTLHDNPNERNESSHGNVFSEPAQAGNPRQRSFSFSSGSGQAFRLIG